MPELPEVETVVNELQCLVGYTVTEVKVNKKHHFQGISEEGFCFQIKGEIIQKITRKGK